MGGDGGVAVTVPAALQALARFPELRLNLVGDTTLLQTHTSNINPALRQRLELTHTDSIIGDDDEPGKVLRSGVESSMYQATELVQCGQAEAMVSGGNTGALLMISRHLLNTIEGIDKPALIAKIPTASGMGFLLDVGANPQCDARQLFQFAVMGAVLGESLHGVAPKVGLLNIGEENFKGTTEVRAAADLLRACPAINFVGYIEADNLFSGAADVVVCDGFVGNVTIKSSAGVVNMVKDLLATEMQQSRVLRLSRLLSSSWLTRLSRQTDPSRYNGASLLGLQGSIVKSHGNTSSTGFANAIYQAMHEVEHKVPQLIARQVATIMADS